MSARWLRQTSLGRPELPDVKSIARTASRSASESGAEALRSITASRSGVPSPPGITVTPRSVPRVMDAAWPDGGLCSGAASAARRDAASSTPRSETPRANSSITSHLGRACDNADPSSSAVSPGWSATAAAPRHAHARNHTTQAAEFCPQSATRSPGPTPNCWRRAAAAATRATNSVASSIGAPLIAIIGRLGSRSAVCRSRRSSVIARTGAFMCDAAPGCRPCRPRHARPGP
jgi:hypothetical protein